MFTLQQLKAAHAKVKSGADFPAYVQEIKELGLLHYDFMVRDGQVNYYGNDDFQLNSEPIYAEKIIARVSSAAAVQQIILEHQQGKSDFLTFCSLVADAGVEKWVVDTESMLCSYYDLAGNSLVIEPIPTTKSS